MTNSKSKTENTDKNLIARPPIVAVLGHIDHGKSTLLDYIRTVNTTDKEIGGITQNMSAYEVIDKNGKKITFLDTPGHEAFQELRGRGTKVADIGILVVSAEDGVKQQTLEALKAITEAKLPYIVAINKIDKEGANVEKTIQNLSENGIYIEGYGGDVPSVPISAKTGKGIPELLEMINLLSEVEDFKANPNTQAQGIVLETNRDTQKGISATLLIKDGVLLSGDFVVAGEAIAPVRIFEDFQGNNIKTATFSAPIKVIGFDEVPSVGELFTTYKTKKEAEKIVSENRENRVTGSLPKSSAHQGFSIPVVVKADTSGVLEAIEHEIRKCENEKAGVNIVLKGIGNITDNDIKLAAANLKTLVIGFNTKVDASAKSLSEKLGIDVKVFDIIYKLSEWLKVIVEERTPRSEVEEDRGKAKILKIFSTLKGKQVVGGRLETGSMMLNDEVVIIRRENEIGRGRVRELQQSKAKTSEVKEGSEFGALIESQIELSPGDHVNAIMKVIR